jgi:hypothetical protein
MSDSTFPIVVTAAGLQPTPPATLLNMLLTLVASTNPGYTANLPGSLIEDISSTDVGALALCNQAMVETVNSLTPYGANAFLLRQLGQQFGVQLNAASSTSVFVQFESDPGFVIGKGFTVSDGTHQYALSDGGVIGSDGLSELLFAVATVSGTWVVPAGTVTQLVTSVPPSITMTVTNPSSGTPGADAETQEDYRVAVLQAGLAAAQGMATMLKTQLRNVPGVQPRLVSAVQIAGGGWEILCGGGDPYQVAYAIFRGVLDITSLVGSTMSISGITQANPGVVTTTLNHGYATGNNVTIAGVNPTNYNGSFQAITLTEKKFGLGLAFAGRALTALSWSSAAGGTATGSTGSAHGVTVGSTFVISGADPTAYNGTHVAIAGTTGNVLKWALTPNPGATVTPGSLAAGVANVDTTGFPAYVSGGVCTPNARNIVVSLQDYPDVYNIPYVNPPQQTVTMAVTWNTTAMNFVSDAAIQQYAAPALVDYVNSIAVGQPMNELVMKTVFQAAISSILPAALLTRLVFAVSINGVATPDQAGTGIIAGDTESYFFAQTTGITVTRG